MGIPADQLEALRDELIKARAKGVRVVQMNGERVEYKSDAEQAEAIAALDRQIARAASRRPTSLAFSTSKGV
jgi:hypothetical protein